MKIDHIIQRVTVAVMIYQQGRMNLRRELVNQTPADKSLNKNQRKRLR